MNKTVAIPVDENGVLERHFGQTRLFDIYQILDNSVVKKETLTPPPHAPGVLPKWLVTNNVTDVLVFTMGERANKILEHFDIRVFLGAPVINSDEIVQGFIADTIEFSAELCHQHHEHHHEHNHQHHHGQNHGHNAKNLPEN